MKRKQRAIKEFDFSKYDFSDCVEITGDALYLINGGGAKTSGKSDSGSSQGSGDNSSSGDNTYTVQSGNTLSQIVSDYNEANGTNLTVAQVAQNSGISNPDQIYPGQQINFGTSQSQTSETPQTNEASSKTSDSFSSGASNSSSSSSNASDKSQNHNQQNNIEKYGFNRPAEYSSNNKLSTNDVSNVSNKNNYSKYQEMMRARVTNAEAMELSQRAEKAAEEGKDFNANAEISQMRGESLEGNAAATVQKNVAKKVSEGCVAGYVVDEEGAAKNGHGAIFVENADGTYSFFEVNNLDDEIKSGEKTSDSENSKIIINSEILSNSPLKAPTPFTARVFGKATSAGAMRRDFKNKEDLIKYLKTAGPNGGYDKILEFTTTPEQNKVIYDTAMKMGKSFNDYELIGNSCGTWGRNVLTSPGTGINSVETITYTINKLNASNFSTGGFLAIQLMYSNAPNDIFNTLSYFNESAHTYRIEK